MLMETESSQTEHDGIRGVVRWGLAGDRTGLVVLPWRLWADGESGWQGAIKGRRTWQVQTALLGPKFNATMALLLPDERWVRSTH